jgi:hypothetical protein
MAPRSGVKILSANRLRGSFHGSESQLWHGLFWDRREAANYTIMRSILRLIGGANIFSSKATLSSRRIW